MNRYLKHVMPAAPEKHLNRLLRFPVSIERNHKKPID